jgi:tetratricopeptide (TPR) repeat protein
LLLCTITCRAPADAEERTRDTSSLAVKAPELPDGLLDAPETASVTTLSAAFTGCSEVRRGPLCVIDERRTFHLWVRALAPADVRLSIDGETLDLSPSPSEDGLLWRFSPTHDARHLKVRARTPIGPAEFHLRLAPPAAPLPDELRAAQRFLRARTHDNARARAHIERLEALLASDAPALSGRARVITLGRLARLHYQREEPERALQRYEDSTALAERLGLTSMLRADAMAAAYISTTIRPDHVAARRWFALEASTSDSTPDAYAAYLRGLLAVHSGDYEDALRHYQRAAYLARRLGLLIDERDVQQMWGLLLDELGRHADARARFDRAGELTGPETSDCERAELLTNRAISAMRTRASGEPAEDPKVLLEEVVRLNTVEGGCGNQESINRARLNLAREALDREDSEAARDALAAVSPTLANLSERLRRLDLSARYELLNHRPRVALERWVELSEQAGDNLRAADRWSLEFGRAQAFESLGEIPEALTAYARAEAQLDAQLLNIAFDQGREYVALGRHRSARHYIDLLIREGLAPQALCAARRARARATYPIDRAGRLAALAPASRRVWDARIQQYRRLRRQLESERRDDWRLSHEALLRVAARRKIQTREIETLRNEALALLADATATTVRCRDLRAPDPGEVILLYHPVVDGWIGFAATSRGVTITRVASDALRHALATTPLDRARVSALLLAPFREVLERAEKIRVLPLQAVLDVPFHALPWPGATREDELVIDHAQVAYAVDLPQPAAPGLTKGQALAHDRAREGVEHTRRAVVLADPRSNLEHLLHELGEVDSILDARRWSVELLHAGNADNEALREVITSADHLHYAGHGLSDGLAGAGSFVTLADGHLGVGDILVLPRVPQSVVLAGCETGLTNAHTLAGGMSVARAFLAAGSASVIAASHEIDDELAAAISTELYEVLALEAQFDGPALLQRAQQNLRKTAPHTGWSELRAWTP